MPINPPYRFDPLSNPVNVKWHSDGGPCGWRPTGAPHLYDLGGQDAGIPFLLIHPDSLYPDGHPLGFTLVHYDEQDWEFFCP
jgi:hypothetical protein